VWVILNRLVAEKPPAGKNRVACRMLEEKPKAVVLLHGFFLETAVLRERS